MRAVLDKLNDAGVKVERHGPDISIRRNGRLNELELVGEFKTSNFLSDLEIPFLFKDATLGPRLRACGKLRFNGPKVRDRDLVDRIFDRCMG